MSDVYEDDFEDDVNSPQLGTKASMAVADAAPTQGGTEPHPPEERSAEAPEKKAEDQTPPRSDPIVIEKELNEAVGGKISTPSSTRSHSIKQCSAAQSVSRTDKAAITCESWAQTEGFEGTNGRGADSEESYKLCIGGAMYTVPSSRPASSRPTSSGFSRPTSSRGAHVPGGPSRSRIGSSYSSSAAYIANELRKIDLVSERKCMRSSEAHEKKHGGATVSGHEVSSHHLSHENTPSSSSATESIESASGHSIFNAACAGDVDTLKKLITDRCALTGVSTASFVGAAGYVTLNRVQYGLKRCGSTYTLGLGGRATPLQFAAAMGHAAAVKCLLDLGAVDGGGLGALPSASRLAESNGFSAVLTIFKAFTKSKKAPRRRAESQREKTREATEATVDGQPAKVSPALADNSASVDNDTFDKKGEGDTVVTTSAAEAIPEGFTVVPVAQNEKETPPLTEEKTNPVGTEGEIATDQVPSQPPQKEASPVAVSSASSSSSSSFESDSD